MDISNFVNFLGRILVNRQAGWVFRLEEVTVLPMSRFLPSWYKAMSSPLHRPKTVL